MSRISDRQAFIWIGLASAGLLAFIFWLTYVHKPAAGVAWAWVRALPHANALFNLGSASALVLGYLRIRRGDWEGHRRLMLASVALTTGFLLSYTLQHHFLGDTRFGGQGWIRPLYFFILISHISLSALITPLVMAVLFFALTGRLDKHRRLARFTLPLWLYVGVTGVMVYLFLEPYR